MAEWDDKKMFSLEVSELEVEGMENIKTLQNETLCMTEMAFPPYIFTIVSHGSLHSHFKR